MSGRSVFLLAVFLLTLSSVVPAGQQRAGPAIRLKSPAELGRDLPRIRRPVGELPRLIRPRPPNRPPGTAFSQLANVAGTIFSGTVARVEYQPAIRGHAVATVRVTFHVENPIRGAPRGRDFTASEWIGLWHSGQRYRVGEHVVVFFYPPSKLGLTSSVGGPMGRFATDSRGTVLLSPRQLAAFRRDPVLGGRSRVSFSDFALAVRQAREEE
jgi:hypothetical protein